MNLTKRIGLSGGIAGLVLASILMFGVALAQTETTAETTAPATDISPELVPLAQELGCQTTAQCAEKFDANLETGIALAQKYDIYTPEQKKVASTFKTEVLERLKTVSQDNFEEEILALANKILKEKPALARTIGVTRGEVDAATTIINTVKDAGVDIRTCQKSPEDLSREQLIACVKAGNNLSNKEKVAGDYIPKENAKAGEMKRMLDLEDSLLSGEYPGLGKIGVEQAGQICLKPDSKAIADCDRIAERFFGAEGVKQLEEARLQTTRIKEYYVEGITKMELLTPDGQKLIGKGAIKNACDRAFEENNLGLARACGNFAVKNGYATEDEIEDGLKLLETFSQKAEGKNFDDCRFDPESCREFLPDEFRSQFDTQSKIFKIMSESIGFDPSRCENTYDADIGKRCLEGAKKALSQVEEIAKSSPEARRIVDEIRSHIAEGERMTERRDEFNQDSERGGNAGPGGCRGPEECYKYCTQPGNSAECISFGAKSQIFEQNTVVQKFNFVNERLSPTPGQYPGFDGQRQFDFMPYPNQPEQIDPGFNRYPYPERPAGPSPECFAAISSGDFVRAKTVCSSTTENYPRPIAEPYPYPVCPAYAIPSPCPEGQMRQMATDGKGCPTYGACTVIENYKPINICPKMPTVSSCPSGQEKYETYSSGECGTYYACRSTTTTKECPAGMWWDGATNSCTGSSSCGYGQYWDPVKQMCQSSTQTSKQCDWSIDYLKMSTNTCVARSTCYVTSNSDYNSSECQGVRSSTTPTTAPCPEANQYRDPEKNICITQTSCPPGQYWDYVTDACAANPTTVVSGCGSFTTQSTCQATSGCGWANGACGGNATTNYNTCPSGQYWYTPPGGGAGYCQSSTTSSMSGCFYPNATQNGSSLGWTVWCERDYYNCRLGESSGASVSLDGLSLGTPSSCASGWMTPNYGSGNCPAGYHSHSDSGGYCINDQENYSGTCYNSSGTATMTCPQMTYTSSCPSGQYWYTPSGGGAGYCMSSSTTSCSGDQYWNGSACVANSTTYTTDPSAACAQGGGTWNTSTNYCQMSTTSTSCSSGQYWNGSACVSSSTTSSSTCGSGQYWDGSACVSSSTSTTSSSSTSCGSGQWWDGTACQNVTTPSSTCSSSQYWNGSACVDSSTSSSTTSSSSSDMSTACAQAGGAWDGSSCVMPTSSMVLCSQSGGIWTGAACSLAENTAGQKAYYGYYQKQSSSLLGQAIGAFADLFR